MPTKIDRLKTAAKEAHRLDLIDNAGLKALTDGRASKADVELAKSVVADVENWVAALPARRKSSKTTEFKKEVAGELLKATKALHAAQSKNRAASTRGTPAPAPIEPPRVSTSVSTSSGKGATRPTTTGGKGAAPAISNSSSSWSSGAGAPSTSSGKGGAPSGGTTWVWGNGARPPSGK